MNVKSKALTALRAHNQSCGFALTQWMREVIEAQPMPRLEGNHRLLVYHDPHPRGPVLLGFRGEQVFETPMLWPGLKMPDDFKER